jgi:hypothetical protein
VDNVGSKARKWTAHKILTHTQTRILDTPDESGEPPCLDNGMSHIGMFRRYAAVIDGVYV